jgi:hypothetical protein
VLTAVGLFVVLTYRKRKFAAMSATTTLTMHGQLPQHCIKVLSISSDQQRLIVDYLPADQVLQIYSLNGSLESKISLPGKLVDAMWTAEGHILCSVANDMGPLVGVENTNMNSTALVLLVSLSGDVIAHTPMTAPRALSTWYDDVVYLADLVSGVYRSMDGGRTWSHVFKTEDKWFCIQVIQVSSDMHVDTLWTIEQTVIQQRPRPSQLSKWFMRRLRVYTLDKQSLIDSRLSLLNATTLSLPSSVSIDTVTIKNPEGRPMLAYDHRGNVFLSDTQDEGIDVHLLSLNGQYQEKVLKGFDVFAKQIHSLAMDIERSVMYVGLCGGTVGVLTLTYEDEAETTTSIVK